MKKSKILIQIIVFLSIIFNGLICSQYVSASWLGPSQKLTRSDSILDISHPSIAYNSTGGLYFTYTQHVYQNDDHEIYLGNNSAGKERALTIWDLDDIVLSEGNGGADPILNTSHNYRSEICIDNDIQHIVWHGRPYLAADYEIAYTNSSNFSNVMQVSDAANDGDTNPSIAVVNNTVFIIHNNNGDIYIGSTLGGWSSLFSPINAHITRTGTIPKLSSWSNSTYWRIDLAYDNDLGGITYQWLESTDSGLSDIQSNSKSFGPAGTPSDISIDSNQNMAAIAWIDGNDVYVANTTDPSPTEKRITVGGVNEGDPDVVINENDIITVFFVRNLSATQSVIAITENHGSYFTNIDYIIERFNIPLVGGTQLTISSIDACMIPGEGVILIYEAKIPDNFYPQQKLYISGFGNIYNDGMGNYNYYTWIDDIGGYVPWEGWVIEAIEFSYNTSMGNDLELITRLTDIITNETWYNKSTFQGSGGNYSKKVFFQPDNYFIARNAFRVEILNGSNTQDLLKLEIDPLEFPFIYDLNYTSDYNNGTFAYTIQDENLGSGYEFTVFYFDRLRVKKDRPFTKLISFSTGTFDTDNYVDLYKFDMEAGEQYNMSLTVNGTGDNTCRLMIFNSTPQITSKANALYTLDITSITNGSYFQLYAPKDEIYYIIIENLNYSENYDYLFRHQPCPMVAKLLSPTNNSFIMSPIVTFVWDLNDNENSGGPNLFIDHFEFAVYNDSSYIPVIDEPMLILTNITLQLIGGAPYDLPDGRYYWNLTIVTNDNQRSNGIPNWFTIDTIPPSLTVLGPSNGSIWITPPSIQAQFSDLHPFSLWYNVSGNSTQLTLTNSSLTPLDPFIWDNLSQGAFNISFNAMDSAGLISTETRTFFKDTLGPNITVLLPINNSSFGISAPNFSLSIEEANLNSTWYSINGTNFTFNGTDGTINQTSWEALDDGYVNITFYANDTVGNLNFTIISIIKDTQDPVINITLPKSNAEIGRTAPSFEVIITDLTLNKTWYSLDGGVTMFTFSTSSGFGYGQINQIAWQNVWDSLSHKDTITIIFFANDSLNQLTQLDRIVIKYDPSTESTPGISLGGYFILFATLGVIYTIYHKKYRRLS
jgi:hypothetical protein